jgi:phosphoglucosamine mutase
MLRVMQKSGCAASELPPVFDNWPQLLVNVRVQDAKQWKQAAGIHSAIEDAERRLGGRGRVVVRPSGTQPMIRVMVEAQSAEERDSAAEEIVGLIERELGGNIQGRVDLTHALGD